MFDITEADDAKTQEQALIRVEEYACAYFAGEETMGVLAMYEHAAHKAGVSWHVIWDVVNKAKAQANQTR